MTTKEFRELTLSLPGVIEKPHFNRIAFKIDKKRNFATLHEENESANIKFSPEEQAVFCKIYADFIYPVDNKWGLQDWTTFEIKVLPHQIIQEALHSAYKLLNNK